VRSRSRPGSVFTAALLLLTTAPLLGGGTADSPATQHRPDRAQIASALKAVKADPNLATERTIRTLKWRDDSQPTPASDVPGFMEWFLQLMAWIAQSARTLVWVAVGLMIGLLAIFLLRLWRTRRPSEKLSRKLTPTHVQDLDIRPESLPADIGVAARALWDSGQHRSSLSLLYRGLLSRLVHVHNVPVRDSSTEGDTLQLASARLVQDKKNYVAQLIAVWQHSVYGGQEPAAALLYSLCDDFGPSLDVT
jgi:Domain of unknown function (DUF4129)